MEDKAMLLLLQLSDSAFPVGGFSHSCGLEALLQSNGKQRTDKNFLQSAFVSALENAGSFGVPFVQGAYQAGLVTQDLKSLDRLCQASSPNHIACRASTRQGQSFREVCSFVCTDLDPGVTSALSELPHCHVPVVHGALFSALGFDLDTTLTAFLFGVVRNVVAAAVRLDAVGPMEAQRMQKKLQDMIPDVILRNKWRSADDASVTFPVLDILQNTQDTLFCKLFYS
ncbi:urease accessory protein F [Aplysia californica]|uniref:Urease accessory protein F n=1 Tax=Aplysia californica TaxID=6500 RepID=A0ABM0K5G6_APLCA|nr:urease accessory protein F [Aplysia californica]